MRIAFPVKENNGLESIIDDHFGTAGLFLIVDMDTKECELTENQKMRPDGAKCKEGVIGEKSKVDAVITKCMGDGVRRNLMSSSIKVFQARKDSVLENLKLMEKNELKLFHIFDLCQAHKNKKEGGCGRH